MLTGRGEEEPPPRWKDLLATAQHDDADSQWRQDINFRRLLDRASSKAVFTPSQMDGRQTREALELASRAAEMDHLQRVERERSAARERLGDGPLEQRRLEQGMHAETVRRMLEEEAEEAAPLVAAAP
mmetsp:Transcript_137368/g.426822  ORF Transcript_137368/g.426822 Transcript_137368/m.426822 type:complete len:128 (+) Transcript_137368:125-508(+)